MGPVHIHVIAFRLYRELLFRGKPSGQLLFTLKLLSKVA